MKTIGIVGTGAMGRGIIQWALEAGASVLAFDARAGAAIEAVAFVGDLLKRAVAKGRMTEAACQDAMRRIQIAGSLGDLHATDMVVEAIVEDLEAKRSLFTELESVVRDDTVLCTNTSALSITSCARVCRHPGRVIGLHFFNPVPLMKVVEVIQGERTAPDVVDRVLGFIRQTAHHPVVCSDTPGFVVNHAGRGLSTEGLRIVQEGVATYADVDRVMRDYARFPMGPFELFDLTGLDVSSLVLREVYEGFQHDPRLRPTPLPFRRVEAGRYGRKVDDGFYQYADGKKIEPNEADQPEATPGRVYLDVPAALRPLFLREGMEVTENVASADAIVISPIGDDATTGAVAAGYDPQKVVAIDGLFPDRLVEGGRATVMTTPLTTETSVSIVQGLLTKAGLRITRIADSPGFIAQRMLANIVNTACDIAQQRIAVPDDIDEGVRRGLGYPAGPLAIGDQIGAPRVLQILQRLQALTGDPRYRPSPWLRRRAQLGISLKTPE